MANVLVENQSLQDIADAIREKNGTEDTYKPSEMAAAIEAISGGGITPTGTKSITANGTYDVTDFASAEVAVPTGGADLGTKSITANGTYNASADDLDGYSSVTVNVSGGGGGVTVQEGTFTLESDIAINPEGVSVPVGFTGEPDAIFIWMDDTTFQSLASISNNRIYKAMLVKRNSARDATFPPTRMSNTTSAQSVLAANATHIYGAATTATTCSASANGSGVGNIGYATSNTDKNKINADGTITIARASTAAQTMFAGTYHYIAVNGVNFGFLC